MSSIPPNWISSVVGGVSASGRASEAKNKEDADRTRSVDNASFAERLGKVIESDDADMQVDSESEGRGSQGRAFSEETPDDDAQEQSTAEETLDGGSLDLEA